MSSTETNTEPAQLTVIGRVLSIPLVSCSLENIDGRLSSNAYTRSSYSTAKGLSDAALKFSKPIQTQFSPIICRADQYANKAVDFVEARYPFPMKATPDEVYNWVKETQESYVSYASRTIDERVRSPALHVAQGIDKSFAPVVDIFEDAAHRFGSHPNSPTTESPNEQSQYQYQRALSISKTLRTDLQIYSDERIKALQAHSSILNHATETAQAVASAAQSSIAVAQARVQALSDSMLAQSYRLQQQLHELSATLSSSAAAAYQNSSQQIPELQKSLREISSELQEIVTAQDLSLQEKASRVGKQMTEKATPVLDAMKVQVAEFWEKFAKTPRNDTPPNGANEPVQNEQ